MTVLSFRSQQASDYFNFNVHNVLLKATTPIVGHSRMNARTYYFVTCELLSAAAGSLTCLPRCFRHRGLTLRISRVRKQRVLKGRQNSVRRVKPSY